MASVARFDTWQAADGTNVARFTTGVLETWDGSAWVRSPVSVNYLVIAGGGGGGRGNNLGARGGGGGGAGGYRCSVTGENSGGTSSPEPSVLVSGTFRVTVGAGGVGGSSTYQGAPIQTSGNYSVFASIISDGGGHAGDSDSTLNGLAGNGGSGGGGGGFTASGFGSAFAGQGTDGAIGNNISTYRGGGGGGAGTAGATGATTGNGGNGLTSSITGSAVARGGGGGGGGNTAAPIGSGGSGGGGAGAGTAGTVNTGGGGGGGGGTSPTTVGGAGGSGVVIFSLPTSVTVTFSGGVTQTSAVVGSNTVYTVTATSTISETVTFS